jgi:hypothetical protein
MFDNLRDLSDDSALFPEPEEIEDEEVEEEVLPPTPEVPFLGMTAIQRFILSALLLGTVIVVGALCLMVTRKIAPF